MAVKLSQLGALGVINLEGIQTRYDDPEPILHRIASVGKSEFVSLMQELYAEPIKPELIEKRIQEIKQQGGIAAVSATPAAASKYGQVVAKAGADLFFVQATVVSTAHLSPESIVPLDLAEFCRSMPIPVALGNCFKFVESWGRRGISGNWPRCSLYLPWCLGCWCTPSKCDRRLCCGQG
jgi:IMP dehydrogenase